MLQTPTRGLSTTNDFDQEAHEVIIIIIEFFKLTRRRLSQQVVTVYNCIYYPPVRRIHVRTDEMSYSN